MGMGQFSAILWFGGDEQKHHWNHGLYMGNHPQINGLTVIQVSVFFNLPRWMFIKKQVITVHECSWMDQELMKLMTWSVSSNNMKQHESPSNSCIGKTSTSYFDVNSARVEVWDQALFASLTQLGSNFFWKSRSKDKVYALMTNFIISHGLQVTVSLLSHGEETSFFWRYPDFH